MLCVRRKRYDELKAELHTALKLSPDEIESIEDAAEEKYMLKFFAMYLAAEKRDNDSFPLILNFFATYAERAWNSLGNMSTRDLGRILASVCHGDVNALKSGEEAEAAHLGLMLLYNRLNEDHLEGTLTDPFDAVDNIGKALAPMTREWCRGFACAMGLRPECWLPQEDFNEMSNFTKAITPILMLSDQRKADDLLKISGKKNTNTERKKLLKGCLTDLPLAIETLIERARAHGTAYMPDALRHLPAQSSKAGRNTLCPCGSGKKFKKCCGIPGKVVH